VQTTLIAENALPGVGVDENIEREVSGRRKDLVAERATNGEIHVGPSLWRKSHGSQRVLQGTPGRKQPVSQESQYVLPCNNLVNWSIISPRRLINRADGLK